MIAWPVKRLGNWSALFHGHAALIQQITGVVPDFHTPVSTVYALLAVGAITLGLVGPDPQTRGLAERISLEPTVDDDAVTRRSDAG